MADNFRAELSWASLAGAVFSLSLIAVAIAMGTHNFWGFLSMEGFLIVIGGSLAVAFMSFQANYVIEALKSIGFMFMRPTATHENLHQDIIKIISWAQTIKERGLKGLETKVKEQKIDDHFVRYGLDMLISNYTPAELRSMMETAADASFERDTIPARILQAMASHAPAFGMVGTLVGMIIMLGKFDGDMSDVGKGLGIALLATLYGVLAARLLYIPAASKSIQKQETLRFHNQLITEGMVMLVENRSPRYIQDRLNSFLRPESHYDVENKIQKAIAK